MAKKTGKSRQTRKKKKKDNRTYYSISAFILIVILFITIFQLGVIGTYTDAFFAYLFGTSRYFTYLMLFLTSIYLAAEQKIPLTRRMGGYMLMQFGLLFLFHTLLYIVDRARIEDFYTFQQTVETIQTVGIMAFFGGGIIGQVLFSFSSTGISMVGTLLLGLIFLYISYLLITSKDIEQSISHDMVKTSKVLKGIANAVIRGLGALYEQLARLFSRLVEKASDRKKADDRIKTPAAKKQPAKTMIAAEKGAAPKQPAEFEADESIIETMHEYDRTEAATQQETTAQKASDSGTTAEIEKESTEATEIEYENEDYPDDYEAADESSDGEPATFDEEEIKQLKQYELPSITMLKDAEVSETVSNKEVLKQGKILEETLKNFGVNAKVSKIRIGPAVTQFEIQPDIGVKVSKIINLQNDIALSLAAKDIRIEAPIPGKSAVGIEVPNSVISMVTLREVLKRRTSDNPLEVALGKDISGSPISAELNKMPHLLVAGSTGSGKSVCINGIIISLLMNAKPHEVKLMMIDPKMVELNVYNGIPHLLSPVVTNPQKASDALNRIVSEMERRYDLFSHSNTRNIEAYNQYLERESETPEKVQKLPYIVVIIDELADLMMVASKDVEASITRIAQMARAAGIHLIIATQRPSVDVITGIIKANIPSRIAFSVSSQTDSRTIIDSQGAEKLLGRGDMLFLPSGKSKPIRVQGAFLSDNEVSDVVHYITSQMKANYEKSIMNKPVQKEQQESEDALYPDAKWFVIEEQRASASLLQRQFRVGYNRAARLIDDLEANGVIGPSSGSKPRNVLVQNEE
ncbi:DNA translocase FtsK [Salinicoccus sp. ID82-1]|uniref:DNA translocase FtsK n=1 Tax=Salinicoccus cyprini TaxID=2493691 RepID=A0A558AY76_9STAP|nr:MULTISPECIES: DNA translocase FtsK [Salinicoccus]MCG1008742.1 DNA translocase FtsK [Salinicoccus sp. ID82-1]TVT29217.1 DNA translocase FtsK [Salinicoccus cyprini]